MDMLKPCVFSRAIFMAATVGISLAAATANAGVYSLSIWDVQRRQDTSCEQMALNEGNRLVDFVQANLGRSIALRSAVCVDDEGGGLPRWKFRISYESEAALPLVAAGRSTSSELPVYATAAECEAAIAPELAKFTANTGLAAFRSYCRVPLYKDSGWNLEILGFGVPRLAPRNISTEIFGTVMNHTRESYFEMISAQFRRDSMDVAHLVILNRFPYLGLAIRYYGNEDIRVAETGILGVEGKDNCVARAERVGMDLADHGFKNYGTYCSQHMLDKTRFTVTSLLPLESPLKLTLAPEAFKDLPACESQLEATIRYYRDDLRRDITNGYCSLDPKTKTYQTVLFERN